MLFYFNFETFKYTFQMSDAFQLNRKTTRLQNWNYSWKRLYFVTINTKFGEPYFGEIVNDQVQLNDIGREVEKQWLMTPSYRPDMNLITDEFIVMPNHFHGIIGIGGNEINSNSIPIGGIFGPQIKNLGSIIRGFKSSVTSWCKNHHTLFDWQSRYHDIIIHDDIVLNKIRNYIRNNPKNWNKDRFYKS